MKNKFPLILALALVALLATLLDPFMLLMPSMATMLVLVALAVLILAWMGFVLKEGAGDEREALHRMHAGRAAYLAGLAVLTAALLYQGFTHALDPWVVAALAAMILVKVFSRSYLESHA